MSSAETALAYQRRLVAVEPHNFTNLKQLSEASATLKTRYPFAGDNNLRASAVIQQWEQLRIAEIGLWLTQQTLAGSLNIRNDEHPLAWIQKAMSASRWLRDGSSPVAGRPAWKWSDAEQQSWDAYVAANDAVTKEIQTIYSSQTIHPTLFAAAKVAAELGEAIATNSAARASERQNDYQSLSRVLLKISKAIYQQSPQLAQVQGELKSLDLQLASLPIVDFEEAILESLAKKTASQPAKAK